ncbi:CD300 molecule like family member f [Phyllostomus discolor]|uniref:CD300 molecule like family member f n=1 Tax=Phyllostomus discolor TaxID=89673 RepID=A0A833ZBW7_9CHIR|nr:CD300 molecule like family member f [Phyllostomus discolor]
MHLLLLFPLLFRLSGSSGVIMGPEEARGPERGSLTVQCRYVPGWEKHVKYWCRGSDFSICRILVRTAGSEQEVKKDRVSIRDNQTSRVFTVTMEKLRREDADTYWCVIERAGSDHGAPVKVTVGPPTTTVSTTIPTTTFSEVPTSSPTVSSLHPEGRDIFHILLPLLSALLLLLLVAASLLAWRIVKRRKKAAGTPPEQALQPLESDVCYANLTLQQPGGTPGSARKRASEKHSSSAQEGQAQVEYITVASFPKEDISYAALSLDGLHQDATYANTGDLVTHLPRRSHEELTEYSTIMKH